jgi:hypothetical protein
MSLLTSSLLSSSPSPTGHLVSGDTPSEEQDMSEVNCLTARMRPCLLISIGTDTVAICKADFRINATHFFNTTGQGTQELTKIKAQKSSMSFDIVRRGEKYQGTYVDFETGLHICQTYNL